LPNLGLTLPSVLAAFWYERSADDDVEEGAPCVSYVDPVGGARDDAGEPDTSARDA
jgi:hypothetical protein